MFCFYLKTRRTEIKLIYLIGFFYSFNRTFSATRASKMDKNWVKIEARMKCNTIVNLSGRCWRFWTSCFSSELSLTRTSNDFSSWFIRNRGIRLLKRVSQFAAIKILIKNLIFFKKFGANVLVYKFLTSYHSSWMKELSFYCIQYYKQSCFLVFFIW